MCDRQKHLIHVYQRGQLNLIFASAKLQQQYCATMLKLYVFLSSCYSLFVWDYKYLNAHGIKCLPRIFVDTEKEDILFNYSFESKRVINSHYINIKYYTEIHYESNTVI